MARRRCFTLIELLLALGVITLLGSVLLFKAKPMLDHYRFKHGVARLKEELAFSKRIAQVASADIDFYIKAEKNQLYCTRETDEPLRFPQTVNCKIIIPFLQLEGKKECSIHYTATGWAYGEEELIVTNGNCRENIMILDKSTDSRYD